MWTILRALLGEKFCQYIPSKIKYFSTTVVLFVGQPFPQVTVVSTERTTLLRILLQAVEVVYFVRIILKTITPGEGRRQTEERRQTEGRRQPGLNSKSSTGMETEVDKARVRARVHTLIRASAASERVREEMAQLFAKQASTYAKIRPTYPASLFQMLAQLTHQHQRAWDVGTGNGQAATMVSVHSSPTLLSPSSPPFSISEPELSMGIQDVIQFAWG